MQPLPQHFPLHDPSRRSVPLRASLLGLVSLVDHSHLPFPQHSPPGRRHPLLPGQHVVPPGHELAVQSERAVLAASSRRDSLSPQQMYPGSAQRPPPQHVQLFWHVPWSDISKARTGTHYYHSNRSRSAHTPTRSTSCQFRTWFRPGSKWSLPGRSRHHSWKSRWGSSGASGADPCYWGRRACTLGRAGQGRLGVPQSATSRPSCPATACTV